MKKIETEEIEVVSIESEHTWNYRVVIGEDMDGEETYTIREVYYDAEGNPEFFSVDPVHPFGGSVKELCNDIKMMRIACEQAPIRDGDLGTGI